MRFSAPLDEILRTATHVRVLRSLHELPHGFGVSGREIARRAGVAHPSAAKVLSGLQQQGVVTTRRSLRFDEYMLNPDHVLGSTIRYLFDQERRLVEDLRDTLRPELEQLGVRRAYLFGSVAHGTMSATSDIDLAIEPPAHGPPFEARLVALEAVARSRYGNELNVMVKRSPATARSEATWRRLIKDSIPIFEESR